MEFLGMAKFIFLMTFSALGNAQPPGQPPFQPPGQPPGGGTCLPDVSCTLMLHYKSPGDTPCTGTALRDAVMVTNKPVITWNDGTPAGDPETYILIMADPDAPQPCMMPGFWFHWITEATFDTTSKLLSYGATDLLSYGRPDPPPQSDAHRYQVMLYKANKAKLQTLTSAATAYGANRHPGKPLSDFLSALELKNDESPLASYQFCFSQNPSSGTCRSQGQGTQQDATTPMPGGGPAQAATTTKPPSAGSTTVKSVFQKNSLVLVYSVVLGWMNS